MDWSADNISRVIGIPWLQPWGAVNYYMSQVGLSFQVQDDLAHGTTNLINPDVPALEELNENGIGLIQNDYENVVKVDNNIMLITTKFKLAGTIIDTAILPKNYMENDGNFPMQTLQINMQIDLTKGVDERGVPNYLFTTKGRSVDSWNVLGQVRPKKYSELS